MIRKLIQWIQFRAFMLPKTFALWRTKRTLEQHLPGAREYLLQWRKQYGVDYRGRPLPAPHCDCGEELQLWPYEETGIWAASMMDRRQYMGEGRPLHDVYNMAAQRVQKGFCQERQPVQSEE